MKLVQFLLISALLCLLFDAFSQNGTFYHTITKEEYDSIKNVSWHPGRVFLNNGEYIDGLLYRNFETNCLDTKIEGEKGPVKSYCGNHPRGFYIFNKKDTAFFVNLNIRKEGWKCVRILIDGGEKGISLFRYAWTSSETSKISVFFNSDAYMIEWDYYIWKNGNIHKFMLNSDIKKIIKDKSQTLKYYKKHRRDLDRHGYPILSNIIYLYNNE